VDRSDYCTLLERKSFPECLAVGDHVSVRDASDDVWEEGVVESIDTSMGPRVRKLTYDGAYYWDFIRPLGSTAELKRWSDYEKLRKQKLRAAWREAALGTQEQRAAWREASGDYPAAENALKAALAWDPLKENTAYPEGGCPDVASLLAAWLKATGLLGASQRESLAVIKSPESNNGSVVDNKDAAHLESLVWSSFVVYEVDGDMDELCESLQCVARFYASSQGSIGAGSDDLGDVDSSEGGDKNEDDEEIDKIFGVDELLSSRLDHSKSTSRDRSGSSDSGDLTRNSDVDGEDSNLSEDDDSDDDESNSAKDEASTFSEDDDNASIGDDYDDDNDNASQASSATSDGYDVNAHPSELVFHEVVFLVKKHLDLSKSLSPAECADKAEDALGLDYPPGSTLRQKLNLALLQLRGD